MIGIEGEQQVPPLRYAPVGMTLLFGTEGVTRDNSVTTLSKNISKTNLLNADPSASLGMTKGRVALPSNGRGFSGGWAALRRLRGYGKVRFVYDATSTVARCTMNGL